MAQTICRARVICASPLTYLPEEVKCEHDLKRSGPQHVEEGDEVHEPLCIHRHQVHDFSHRGRTLGGVRYRQGLENIGKQTQLSMFTWTLKPHVHPNLKFKASFVLTHGYKIWFGSYLKFHQRRILLILQLHMKHMSMHEEVRTCSCTFL